MKGQRPTTRRKKRKLSEARGKSTDLLEVTGIEPIQHTCKVYILPLNYTPHQVGEPRLLYYMRTRKKGIEPLF